MRAHFIDFDALNSNIARPDRYLFPVGTYRFRKFRKKTVFCRTLRALAQKVKEIEGRGRRQSILRGRFHTADNDRAQLAA